MRKKDKHAQKTKTDNTITEFEKIQVVKNEIKSQNEFENLLPNHILKGLDKETREAWLDQLRVDEANIPDLEKLSVLGLWNSYMDEYKKVCNNLKLQHFQFDKKIPMNDKSKDDLIKELNMPLANSKMNLIMYGAKRVMLDFMEQIKEPILNLLTFFMFHTMIDVIQIRENLVMALSGKNIFEVLFEELCAKIENQENMAEKIENKIWINLQEKLSANDAMKRIILSHENEINKLKDLLDANIKENTQENIKLVELVNMSKINYVKITKELENTWKYCDLIREKMIELKDSTANGPKALWEKIRKLNARCQGLHNRIIKLEDKEKNLRSKSSHSNEEYDESEDSEQSEYSD